MTTALVIWYVALGLALGLVTAKWLKARQDVIHEGACTDSLRKRVVSLEQGTTKIPGLEALAEQMERNLQSAQLLAEARALLLRECIPYVEQAFHCHDYEEAGCKRGVLVCKQDCKGCEKVKKRDDLLMKVHEHLGDV